jgi:hypothetical protein
MGGPQLVAAALVVAGVAGAAWAAARADGDGGAGAGSAVETAGDPEAERTLEAVLAATDEAPSFRFGFQGLDTTMAYWLGGPRRFTGEGVWSTDRWHLITRDQDDASETIRDGDTVYSRWPEPGEDLERAPWERWEDEPIPRDELLEEMSSMLTEAAAEEGELDDGFVDQLAVALAAGLYLDGTVDRVDWVDLEVETFDFPGDPTSFVRAIGRGSTPRLLGRAGGLTTLGVTLRAPDDVATAFGRPIPDGRLEVDVGADHLPVALRLSVAGTGDSFEVEVRFSDWGAPVDIDVPAA